MTEKAVIMEESAVVRALTRISHEILERNKGTDGVCLIGIKSRGAALARIIADNIERFEKVAVPCADIDVGHYRDDIKAEHILFERKKPELPFSIEGKKVILVDDVLYTGRTVRAAIEAIFTVGRPAAIQLAILIDRGHRELPIRADYVGKNIPTSRSELICVHIPPFDDETAVKLTENV